MPSYPEECAVPDTENCVCPDDMDVVLPNNTCAHASVCGCYDAGRQVRDRCKSSMKDDKLGGVKLNW